MTDREGEMVDAMLGKRSRVRPVQRRFVVSRWVTHSEHAVGGYALERPLEKLPYQERPYPGASVR